MKKKITFIEVIILIVLVVIAVKGYELWNKPEEVSEVTPVPTEAVIEEPTPGEMGSNDGGHNEKPIHTKEISLEAEKWRDRGLELYYNGKLEEAIGCFNKAIEIEPEFVAAWHSKGSWCNTMGMYKEGLKCYDKALEIDPEYAKALYNKGMVFIIQNEYEEAVEYLGKAIELRLANKDSSNDSKNPLDGIWKLEDALKKI